MKTEFGVKSKYERDEMYTTPTSSLESAETIVKNMTDAGIEASVIWRGVTEWQDWDNLDD